MHCIHDETPYLLILSIGGPKSAPSWLIFAYLNLRLAKNGCNANLANFRFRHGKVGQNDYF